MVDLWMLFNLFLPFVQVLLHTYIDLLREGEESTESKKAITRRRDQRDTIAPGKTDKLSPHVSVFNVLPINSHTS